MAVPPDSRDETSAQEASAQETGTQAIAPGERLVLLGFGGLTAFVGMVVVLIDLPTALRLGVGLPITLLGAALCLLAARRQEAVGQGDVAPQTLLSIERWALTPLAVGAGVGFFLVALDRDLAVGARLPVAAGALLLFTVFTLLLTRTRSPGPTSTDGATSTSERV